MSSPQLPPRLRELCHELSQPLTIARCSLELAMSMEANDPSRATFFEDTVTALERLVQITEAIRDYSDSA